MPTRRLRLPALSSRDLLVSGLAASATALVAYAGMRKLGTAGLLVPLGVVAAAILLFRPVLAVSLVVGLVIFSEGPTFGIFTFTQNIYTQVYKDVSLIDLLVLLGVVAVAVDVVRHRRPARLPRPLAIPLVLLALAMASGIVVGHAAGASLRFAILSEHVLTYLLLLPIAIANLDLDRRQITSLLGAAMALAIFKAAIGLVEVAGHLGARIEGSSTLTYYEPTANWLIMIALLASCAALLARVRPPLWVLVGTPLLIACLLFSYRRSFWIGAVLGLLLVLLLGTSAVGRRLMVPAAFAIAAAIWLLGSVSFQTQLPVVKRVASLSPNQLEANREDRYRLDERANVVSEIRQHPITGLGMTIPWAATARTLALEGEGEGRQYVHFAALWYWLKLGVLGLFAYIGVMLGSMLLAWQAWRRSREPWLRAFGLASLCGLVGLAVIDTTASFTGVDARFTVLLGAQIGILALVAGSAPVPASSR